MDSFNPEIHIRRSGGILAKDLNASRFSTAAYLPVDKYLEKKTNNLLKLFLFSLGYSKN